MDGALILDKSEGITSHSAVLAVRRLLSEPKIGHLGTLDPFATGVLVLLLGKATRLARFYRDREKTYRGTIRFGYSTDSYDRTGRPTSADQSPTLDAAELHRLFDAFIGTYLQQPPAVSAKKIGGVPSYRLFRKGRESRPAAVSVSIHNFEITSVEGSCVEFTARVSSGTYIRSLAHELGTRMGVGAHLSQLRRTAVGEFAESAAVTFEQLQERVRQEGIPLLRMEDLLPEFPAYALPDVMLQSVLHGNTLVLETRADWVKLLDEAGTLKSVAERIADNLYHPVIVFNFENVT